MLLAGLSSFGWLYLKTKWTDTTLREQSLFEQAKVIAGYLKSDDNNSITLNLPPRLAEAYSSPESEYHYAVRDENGQYLFDSGTAVSALPVLSRTRQKLYDYDPDGPGPLRVFGAALRIEVGQRTVFVQVEQKTQDPNYLRMAVVDEFITDGGWLVIPFLLVLLGISIWIVKRALAPITQISALAESIGPTNANIRLPIDQMPLEILPLVQSMNAALDHLKQGLQRQREFNANAAHQLRTPLSVLMANVETLKEPEIASRLRTDVEQMSRIVSQLLLVARLETVSINLDEIVDLNDVAAEIAGSLAPLALATGKSIELDRSGQTCRYPHEHFCGTGRARQSHRKCNQAHADWNICSAARHGSAFNRSHGLRRGRSVRTTHEGLRALLAGRQKRRRCRIRLGHRRSNYGDFAGVRFYRGGFGAAHCSLLLFFRRR